MSRRQTLFIIVSFCLLSLSFVAISDGNEAFVKSQTLATPVDEGVKKAEPQLATENAFIFPYYRNKFLRVEHVRFLWHHYRSLSPKLKKEFKVATSFIRDIPIEKVKYREIRELFEALTNSEFEADALIDKKAKEIEVIKRRENNPPSVALQMLLNLVTYELNKKAGKLDDIHFLAGRSQGFFTALVVVGATTFENWLVNLKKIWDQLKEDSEKEKRKEKIFQATFRRAPGSSVDLVKALEPFQSEGVDVIVRFRRDTVYVIGEKEAIQKVADKVDAEKARIIKDAEQNIVFSEVQGFAHTRYFKDEYREIVEEALELKKPKRGSPAIFSLYTREPIATPEEFLDNIMEDMQKELDLVHLEEALMELRVRHTTALPGMWKGLEADGSNNWLPFDISLLSANENHAPTADDYPRAAIIENLLISA